MERIPNAVYTKELREEAVKLVTDQGVTIPEMERDFLRKAAAYFAKEPQSGTR